MIMKTQKLLWLILFSNQAAPVSGVFCDLEPLVLLQKVKNIIYLVKFEAVSLHVYWHSSVAVYWHSSVAVYYRGVMSVMVPNRKMHHRYWKIIFLINIIITFEHSIALCISVAVQWSDFKILFALSSIFCDLQYTKTFLGKLWQPWKFLNFSATSTLVSYKHSLRNGMIVWRLVWIECYLWPNFSSQRY